MIIFGRRASKIGQLDAVSSCIHCGQSGTQHLTVFARYAHVYWIPCFPLGKVVVAECANCHRTIKRKEFPAMLEQQYAMLKAQLRIPTWHWSGLVLVLFFIAFIFIIKKTTPVDSRDTLLKADLSRMSSNPSHKDDLLAFTIKEMFDDLIVEEMKPSEFEYFTKADSSKLLILIKMPELRRLEKEARGEILTVIDTIVSYWDSVKTKERYIGVHGKYNMMMVRTPVEFENSKIVSSKGLYEFYGPDSGREGD